MASYNDSQADLIPILPSGHCPHAPPIPQPCRLDCMPGFPIEFSAFLLDFSTYNIEPINVVF